MAGTGLQQGITQDPDADTCRVLHLNFLHICSMVVDPLNKGQLTEAAGQPLPLDLKSWKVQQRGQGKSSVTLLLLSGARFWQRQAPTLENVFPVVKTESC